MRNIVKLAAVALIAAVIIGWFIVRQPNNQVTITSVPGAVELAVDGKDAVWVEDGQTIEVRGTEIETEASRDGFTTETETHQIAEDGSSTIEIQLEAVTAEAESILLEDSGYFEHQDEATTRFREGAEEAYENHPILSELPEETTTFSAWHGKTRETDDDFAIHLYLYAGDEEQGRTDFEEWLASHDLTTDDYEIVEHIEDGPPPEESPDIPEPPTMAELEETAPGSLPDPDEISPEGLTAGELALLFSETTTTWAASEDSHPHEGLLRAENLMTPELAEEISIPENPTTTPNWREAGQNNAVSKPWVLDYTHDQQDSEHTITVDVCWAWISDEETPIVDGIRSYDLTISDTGNGYRISEWTYDDPDPFVDNSQGPCQPEDDA